MQSFKKLVVMLMLTGFSLGLTAQEQNNSQVNKLKTETIKVLGACGMCKTRIENTVKTEGASAATWDAKTKMLSVTFDPGKLTIETLGKKLASVGHDTEKFRAPDEVYEKLPGCCRYERMK